MNHSQTATWRILGKFSVLHPHWIELFQKLNQLDHHIPDFSLEQLKSHGPFQRKIIINMVAHFWSEGYVNKQNLKWFKYTQNFWSTWKAHIYFEKSVFIKVNEEGYQQMLFFFLLLLRITQCSSQNQEKRHKEFKALAIYNWKVQCEIVQTTVIFSITLINDLATLVSNFR